MPLLFANTRRQVFSGRGPYILLIMFALMFFFRKVLQSIPSCDIVFCGEAGYVEVTDTVSPVTLILTPEILFVINHDDDEQQQAFAVAELECGVKTGDTTLLTIIWRDTFSSHDDRVGIIDSPFSQLTLISRTLIATFKSQIQFWTHKIQISIE